MPDENSNTNSPNYAFYILDEAPYGSGGAEAIFLDLETAKFYAEKWTKEINEAWIEEPNGRDWINEYKWLYEWAIDEEEGEWDFRLYQDEYKRKEDNTFHCWFPVRRAELLKGGERDE